MPFPDPTGAASLVNLLVQALRALWTDVVDHHVRTAQRLRDAVLRGSIITAPIRIVDVALLYLTGLAGIFVRLPVSTLRDLVLSELRPGAKSRVMTLESAIRLGFDSLGKWINVVTFTDETGLIGFIAQSLGKALWRLRSKVKLLRLIITASSEAELINGLLASFRGKIALFRWVGLITGVLALLGVLGAIALSFGMAFLFFDRTPSQVGIMKWNNKRCVKRGRRQTRTC